MGNNPKLLTYLSTKPGEDHINSNFLDLPKDQGPKPATIKFSNVVDFKLAVDNIDPPLNIYELEVFNESPKFMIQVKISPSDQFKIICSSIGIEYQE